MNKIHTKEKQVTEGNPVGTSVNTAESVLAKILLGTFCRSFFEAITVVSSYSPNFIENETIVELMSQVPGSRGSEEYLLKILEPVIPYPLEELERRVIKEHQKEKKETTFLIKVVSQREWLRLLKAILFKIQNGQIVYTHVVGTWIDKTKTVEFYSIYKVGLHTVMIGIRENCEQPPNIQIYGTTVDCRLRLIQAYDDFEYFSLDAANRAWQECKDGCDAI